MSRKRRSTSLAVVTESKVNPVYQGMITYANTPQPFTMPKNYKAFSKEGYANDTVYKCVRYIAGNGAAIPPKLYTDRTKQKEITSHPLLDRLDRPNNEQSGVAYREAVLAYKLLAGNSYQYAIRAKNGPPDELWTLRPDYMQIMADKNRGITGYKYEHLEDPILPANIGHTKYWNPDGGLYGMSPVEVAAILVDQQIAARKWNLALLQNSARPPGAWIVPTPLAKNERDRLELKLKEKFSGSRNAGTPPVLDGGLSWQDMGLSPDALDWLEGMQYNSVLIANIYNMPPQLVGDTSASTYANVEEAKAASYTEAIFPELDDTYALWNVWLVPMYPDLCDARGNPTAYLYYDKESVEVVQRVIQTQKQAQIDRANKMWLAGECTLDEARAISGLPPLPGGAGQVFRFGAVLVRAEKLTDYADQSLTTPAAPPPAMPEPIQQEPPVKRMMRPLEQKDAEEHTGVMVALFLDSKSADKLAIPDSEPAEDLHITLALLGDTNEDDFDIPALKKLLAKYAAGANTLQGTTTGIGRFAASEAEATPVYASVNIAGIQAWRADLVKQLEAAGFEVASNFEFTPHITLAYVDADAPLPVESIPELALTFDTLWLAVGDDRYSFPIGSEKRAATRRAYKALDLRTAEEKQAYAKSMEQSREKWYSEAEKRLQSYFKSEHAVIVKAINSAALPETAEVRVQHALSDQAPHLKNVLNTLYQDVAADIGKKTLSELKSTGPTERKDDVQDFIDMFGSDLLIYLLTVAGQRVTQITDNTLAELQSQLEQGVRAGESIPQLSKRIDELYLVQIIPNRSRTIARTEVVGSSNWASVQAAKSSGLTLNKVWLATDDTRTRPDHAAADGQEVGMDEQFEVGGVKMDHPGDPTAPADEVVNCRCTLYYKRVKADDSTSAETSDSSNEEKRLPARASRQEYRKFMEAVLR